MGLAGSISQVFSPQFVQLLDGGGWWGKPEYTIRWARRERPAHLSLHALRLTQVSSSGIDTNEAWFHCPTLVYSENLDLKKKENVAIAGLASNSIAGFPSKNALDRASGDKMWKRDASIELQWSLHFIYSHQGEIMTAA